MHQKTFLSLVIAALVLCLCVLPASAVVQEVTLKGTVTALDAAKNTITIGDPARYGCDYPAEGGPVCTFTPIDNMPVTGSVPTSTAFSVFKVGDAIVATSLGGTGGSWITLAKLYGPGQNEQYVTDIVGDPGKVPTPFVGDYSLDIAMAPDCTTCSGTTCTATTAAVKVKSSGSVVLTKALGPKQSMMYNGRNDGSSIAVTLVKGQAPSTGCAGGRFDMAGPQPISIFIVNIVPPVGFAPAGAVAEATIPVASQEPTPAPTHSASLPFAAICAFCIMALVVVARRQ